MKKLKSIYAFIETASIALSVCINQALSDILKDLLKSSLLFYIFSLLVIGFSYLAFRRIFALIVKIRSINKLLLGKDFIAGTWLDILYVNGEVQSVGLSYISIDETEIRISGDDYDITNPAKFGYYESDFTTFAEKRFRYYFKYQYSDASTSSVSNLQGYTELAFLECDSYPTSYRGTSIFKENGSDKILIFEGKKIEDVGVLERLQCSQLKKRALLLALLKILSS